MSNSFFDQKQLDNIFEELDSQEDLKIVVNNITNYISNEMLDEAFILIEETLNSPYIPINLLDFLTDLKKNVKNEINEKKYNHKINSMTKLQMWDKIYNKELHEIDLTFFEIFLDRFENDFDDIDLSILNTILSDKNINNIDKTNLVFFSISIKLDKDLKIYNNDLDKTFIINPVKTDILKQQNEIVDKLNDLYMKTPSKIGYAINILSILTAYYLGSDIPYPNQDIIDSIDNIIDSLFGEGTLIENELNKLLIEQISKLDK